MAVAAHASVIASATSFLAVSRDKAAGLPESSNVPDEEKVLRDRLTTLRDSKLAAFDWPSEGVRDEGHFSRDHPEIVSTGFSSRMHPIRGTCAKSSRNPANRMRFELPERARRRSAARVSSSSFFRRV
jgi:hypothetical protein